MGPQRFEQLATIELRFRCELLMQAALAHPRPETVGTPRRPRPVCQCCSACSSNHEQCHCARAPLEWGRPTGGPLRDRCLVSFWLRFCWGNLGVAWRHPWGRVTDTRTRTSAGGRRRCCICCSTLRSKRRGPERADVIRGRATLRAAERAAVALGFCTTLARRVHGPALSARAAQAESGRVLNLAQDCLAAAQRVRNTLLVPLDALCRAQLCFQPR